MSQGAEPLPPPSPTDLEAYKTEQTFKSGANWFFWIAGMSVVNSVVQLFQGTWGFVVGLGLTQLIDGIAQAAAGEVSGNAAAVIRTLAFIVTLIAALFFVGIGWLARKRKGWAFITGMVLYLLDGLLFLAVMDLLGLAFHGLALFFMLQGYLALRKLAARPAAPVPA